MKLYIGVSSTTSCAARAHPLRFGYVFFNNVLFKAHATGKTTADTGLPGRNLY